MKSPTGYVFNINNAQFYISLKYGCKCHKPSIGVAARGLSNLYTDMHMHIMKTFTHAKYRL